MSPSDPTTVETIAYNRELQSLKGLVLVRQYRNCIQTSEYLLDQNHDTLPLHPYQKVFIKFYQGLAYDELARAMHTFSQAKLPAFDKAAECYKEAVDLLVSAPWETQIVARKHGECPSSVCPNILRPLLSNPPTSPAGSDSSENSSFGSPVAAATPIKKASCTSVRTSSPTSSPLNPLTHRLATFPQSLSKAMRASSSPEVLLPTAVPASSTLGDTAANLSNHDLNNNALHSRERSMQDIGRLDRDFSRISLWDANIQRNYSKMSLLEEPGFKSPPLPKMASQGLLRPIRPGSPVRQYFFPPVVQQYPGAYTATSMLSHSRAQTFPSDMQFQPLHKPEKTSSLKTWLSQNEGSYGPSEELNDNVAASDFGTPSLDMSSPFPRPTSTRATSPDQTPNSLVCPQISHLQRAQSDRAHENISAIRSQLQRHVELAKQARLVTLTIQASRPASRMASVRYDQYGTSDRSEGSNLRTVSSPLQRSRYGMEVSPIPQVRSFWSFTPGNQKEAEKSRRIEAGRKRSWVKPRFNNERYVSLADAALAELCT
ncbi:hypothetical protein K431DRAFT_313761 [Polychaeton citri CBS 116435]|uniref:Uncharacterized protein n=1 Tax=Polychaeton citri CBS 116435 TaxID=1314669 RepID=A0A9P4Q3L5_9PEZI|nr:hypothetical protein K431DRAFT_313761 [Polychaeton citri CBS 116435]